MTALWTLISKLWLHWFWEVITKIYDFFYTLLSFHSLFIKGYAFIVQHYKIKTLTTVLWSISVAGCISEICQNYFKIWKASWIMCKLLLPSFVNWRTSHSEKYLVLMLHKIPVCIRTVLTPATFLQGQHW